MFDYDANSELDINNAIQTVYYCYHQLPRISSDIRTTVLDLSIAVSRDAWIDEELCYAGQVFDDRETGGYRLNKILSLSWTNGLSVAVPVLMAAIRVGDESMRHQALSCISNIIKIA